MRSRKTIDHVRDILWFAIDYFLGVLLLGLCLGILLVGLSLFVPSWIANSSGVSIPTLCILTAGLLLLLLLGVRTGWKMRQRTGGGPLAAVAVGVMFVLLLAGTEYIADRYLHPGKVPVMAAEDTEPLTVIGGHLLFGVIISGACALGALLASRPGNKCAEPPQGLQSGPS